MAKNAAKSPSVITIRGACQNNLKSINLELELNRFHVVTGPSGSGKSSLAFDTIYAEGQRRYVETFSPYTRQFLDRMDKPLVDEILGIPPAIAIEQANRVRTTRSTVGTMTEINDYLKLLFPRVAHAYCPECGREIRPETPEHICQTLFKDLRDQTILVTFGVPVPAGTKPADFFGFLNQQGFLRVWIDNSIERTDRPTSVKWLPGIVSVIQDRIAVSDTNRTRLTEAIEQALRFGKGQVAIIETASHDPPRAPDTAPGPKISGLQPAALQPVVHRFSTGWHCPYCDIEIRAPIPGLFSFNNPVGACPACRGFGRTIGIDMDRALPDRKLSIAAGVVKPFQTGNMRACQQDLITRAEERGVDIHCPFNELSEKDQQWVIQGEVTPNMTADEVWESGGWYGVQGFFDWMESRSYKMHVRVFLSRYRAYTLCRECNGTRFKPETLNFKIIRNGHSANRPSDYISDVASETAKEFNGTASLLSLPDVQRMPIEELVVILRDLQIGKNDAPTEMVRSQIVSRLSYLVDVGLGYLTLDRATRSLSGGEIQRVNLTTCLGASLVNTLFVLDEPSVGLHPRDVHRLIGVLHDLRDKGNTLLVVEHDETVMRAADSVIELGPGRGELGGQLVYQGSIEKIETALPDSLTAAYLTGRKQILIPKKRRKPRQFLEVIGAKEHNLKNLDVRFPLNVFCCVTGVSGSGKSTLVQNVLYENLLRLKGGSTEEAPGRCDRIVGPHEVDEVVLVDQSPLARSPRSTPAVYVGVFDRIRELFAALPEAQARGLTAGVFSFNSGSGRCGRCSGLGYEKIEMQFLSDQYIRCAECEGKRYQPSVLELKLKGKSIHDVLELTVTEAITFFGSIGSPSALIDPLELLRQVGLGYLRLGQPVNVLSGGESQRLKLVGHLTESKKGTRHSLLIFDEPTTGLHFDDIAALLSVFQQLVDQGNTLIVIEHNLDVIQAADYIIDLGPEAGAKGGTLVAQGTPEEVANEPKSQTGIFLRERMVPDFAKAASGRPGSGFRVPGSATENRIAELAPEPETRNPEPETSSITVHGARHHNLKNLSVGIPREKMVVVTGLSGSGKSSLAFDILFAEGQRRFLDSMSTYARQFVEQLERPDVDVVSGLPPSVAIEQRLTQGGGKSTVATLTEVYHFLRLLFAKLGTQHCPRCGIPVAKQTLPAILKQVRDWTRKGPATLSAPLVKARKGFHKEVAIWARREGYRELIVDGAHYPVDRFPALERYKEHTIDVVIADLGKNNGRETEELVKTALRIGNGSAFLLPKGSERVVLSSEMTCPNCGDSFEELDPRLFSFNSPHGWCQTCTGFGHVLPFEIEEDGAESRLEAELLAERRSDSADEFTECPECHGSRLNPVARAVKVHHCTIDQLAGASVKRAMQIIGNWKFEGPKRTIASDILTEINQRLFFMGQVGLDYLTLDRPARTLSGGESQRIRLAAQLGSNLRGVLYVLDEPTIGLHPRDNQRLLETLDALKKKGNTLLVVEHDEETMRRADLIVDLGPGAGRRGGELVALGSIKEIQKCKESVTGQYLKSPMLHPIHGNRRPLKQVFWTEIEGASANNLKQVNVRFPVGRLSVITGVSGSGKSSLLRMVILPAVHGGLQRGKKKSQELGPWNSIVGLEHFGGVYEVDQSPIGKTSRSIPGTYVKVFDEIRALFAQLPESRIRGYDRSRFSFNTEGGRCETCAGQGVIKLEMNFLPSSYIPCEACRGKRFNPQTLAVQYNGKSIGDILEMTIEEAASFFRTQPRIFQPLELLTQTGLGYLQLGQPSPTLSGGEAQRLKLVSELKRGVGRGLTDRLRRNTVPKSTLYLLEEPTIGLHMADVQLLIEVLHRLVDEGNTVIVIEHNLDVIAEADYIVDIGPEAGDAGGKIVACGPPEEIATNKKSRTGQFLKKFLR